MSRAKEINLFLCKPCLIYHQKNTFFSMITLWTRSPAIFFLSKIIQSCPYWCLLWHISMKKSNISKHLAFYDSTLLFKNVFLFRLKKNSSNFFMDPLRLKIIDIIEIQNRFYPHININKPIFIYKNICICLYFVKSWNKTSRKLYYSRFYATVKIN